MSLTASLTMASCSEEVMDVQWAQTVVRKLRKKLRQIERLERLERELTDEELDKVSNISVVVVVCVCACTWQTVEVRV